MTAGVAKKALLVEDNALIRKVAGSIVAQAGYTVETAVNGAEAVDKCRDERYDLVLMDMFMPVMNGDEATRAIRRLPPPAGEVPIVAITASDAEEERRNLLDSGVNACLAKPFTLDQLRDALAGL